MGWVRLDDKRALHAKLRRAGLEARGLDEAVICWCAHEESDGFISDDDLTMLAGLHGCSPKRQKQLSAILCRDDIARWNRDDERGGYWVHDYLHYNPSRADQEERRRLDRERKAKRGGVGADSERNPAGVRARSETPTRPDPTDPRDNPLTPMPDGMGEPGDNVTPIRPELEGHPSIGGLRRGMRGTGTSPRELAHAGVQAKVEAIAAEERARKLADAQAFADEFANLEPTAAAWEATHRWPRDPDMRRQAMDAWRALPGHKAAE